MFALLFEGSRRSSNYGWPPLPEGQNYIFVVKSYKFAILYNSNSNKSDLLRLLGQRLFDENNVQRKSKEF